jgi:hypothetical protein
MNSLICPRDSCLRFMAGNRQPSADTQCALFLDEIFECLPSIHRFGRHGSRRLFLARHPDREKRAVVLHILARHSNRHGLQTLEMARWIEVHTLLAGVQFEPALRAPFRIFSQRRQKRSALRAARNISRSRHLQWPRSEGVFLDWFFEGLLLCRRATILIAALPVLAIGHLDIPRVGILPPLY